MDVSKFGVPLLMVNGNFRSLNTLTVDELESFVPFMTSCTLKKTNATAVQDAPQWWARSIDFKFPLRKPKGLSDLGYKRHLQSIVCKCYCFHDAHFLLTFSSQFAEYPQSIFLKNNPNNTTSVFSIEKVAEIFTFDNENKEYDSKLRDKPYWRNLLPAQTSKPSPKVIGDIYLCENCDVEFYNHEDMQNHEKECFETPAEDTSDEIQIVTHIRSPPTEPGEKDVFLDYFGLLSAALQQQESTPPPKPSEPSEPEEPDTSGKAGKAGKAGKRWVILDMCLHKNRKIEFSSLMGRRMLKHRVKRDVLTRAEKANLPIEDFYDNGSVYVHEVRETQKPKITYKAPKKKIWTHTYCFTKKQKEERLQTLRTGLNKRSRELLKECKELRLPLQRMMLPLEADFFLICLPQRLIIPYRVKTYFESMLDFL